MTSLVPQTTLADFPVGSRLIVRSKLNWRFAVIAKKTPDSVAISIASPTGYNYRIRRNLDLEVFFDGTIPVLLSDNKDSWRDNFSEYDRRW